MSKETTTVPFEEVRQIALQGLEATARVYYQAEENGFRNDNEKEILSERIDDQHRFLVILGVSDHEISEIYLKVLPEKRKKRYFLIIKDGLSEKQRIEFEKNFNF